MERAPTPTVVGRRRVIVAWGALVAAGFAALGAYQHRPGAIGAVPRLWPAGVESLRSDRGPTVLLFAHPRCPCTRATLEGLDRLVARAPEGPFRLVVVFFRPDGADEGTWRTDLVEHAERIPGAEVRTDAGGVLARRFGARTSGQVVAYDEEGQLRFCGGLTPSRGHAGDCAGTDAILRLLRGADPQVPPAPVYGCDLLGAEANVEPAR
ncbi:MAG: hypothetical protein ACF8XB_13745 [Planctomycetota bacterium JB042]